MQLSSFAIFTSELRSMIQSAQALPLSPKLSCAIHQLGLESSAAEAKSRATDEARRAVSSQAHEAVYCAHVLEQSLQ
jgi:hypothetical protein